MATETNDLGAHLNSIPQFPKSKPMLNGRRYSNVTEWEANQWFKIPESAWNNVRDNANDNANGFIHILRWYTHHHYLYQLPRILSLQREYRGDNPIHYWKTNKYKRADNRIASGFGQHTTDFKDGLLFGKPIKYGYANHNNGNDHGTQLLQAIKDFNTNNDIGYHDAILGRDALITGRAYELSYVEANTNTPKVKRINPSQCFIIWSTDVEPKELCAVRYYVVRVANHSWYQIEVYNNNGNVYFYWTKTVNGGWQPLNIVNGGNVAKDVYGDVPITEYTVNETRQGCFEVALDYFDAYDQAISAMANSQEDFNNMTLVVSGKVKLPKRLVQMTDPYGNKMFYKFGKPHKWSYMTLQSKDNKGNPNTPVMTYHHISLKHNLLMLEPYMQDGKVVSQPSANYLTKSLDANEWQVYINELVTRIQQFTGVPNMNNDQSGNQTQLETASRLMDAINEASEAEANFKHGVKRRLRLLYSYLTRLPSSSGGLPANNGSDPSNVTVGFQLNLPLNVQETIQKIQILNQTNKVSTKTIQELAGTIDNVPQSEEANRLSSEQSIQSSQNVAQLNNGFQQEVSASQAANASNNASSGSDINDQSSNANTNVSEQSQIGDNSDTSSIASSNSSSVDDNSDSDIESFSNPNVDSNGSATSEVMDPSSVFNASGSAVSLSSADADNMLAAMLLMDSLYAGSGFPSGFDSTMSNAVSNAFESSATAANAQSEQTGGDDEDPND